MMEIIYSHYKIFMFKFSSLSFLILIKKTLKYAPLKIIAGIALNREIACTAENQLLCAESARSNDNAQSVGAIFMRHQHRRNRSLQKWHDLARSPFVFQEARGRGRNEEIHPVTSCRVR